jgi:hypothetical protein
VVHYNVSDVQVDGEYDFTRRIFGSLPEALRSLAAWLLEQQAQEVVMESTAQYWKPVWGTLERYWKQICQTREGALATWGTLHLAQAQSNRGRRGRKKDFRDAERLVKRLVAHELVLSFVPDVEQRLWRTVVRTKYQLTRNRVELQNRQKRKDFQRDLRRPNECVVAKSLRFVDSVEALATPFGVVVCDGRVYSSIASE